MQGVERVKSTGNLFFTVTFCATFFTYQVVSHFWRKICFRKFKVLTLKIVNSILPKEYIFLQNIPLVLVLHRERCALSNTVGFFYKTLNIEMPFRHNVLYRNRTSKGF